MLVVHLSAVGHNARMATHVETLKEFLRVTEENHAVDERQFRETHAKYTADIEQHHRALVELYKDFFQWTVERLQYSDGEKARSFLVAWMESKRPDLYASAVSDILPDMRKLEARDVMNVKASVSEDEAQYVFGKAPLHFHDPLDL